jgi:quercetin dioxygenase-like cupin family protein
MRVNVTAGVVGGVLASLVLVGHLRATPASGFTGATIAKGRIGNVDVMNQSLFPKSAPTNTHPGKNLWLSIQKTSGPSDIYVQSNTWEVGGSTGWHTHPGHSLIVVTEGAITAYEGDDPTCAPHEYSAGQAFVDEGGDHIHLIRNEGLVVAKTIATQLIPAGATRRVDADASIACGF